MLRHLSKPLHAGVPQHKPLVSWKDVSATIIAWLCFVTGLVAVFSQNVAVYLGQTNQLIIIGFLITIMGICSRRELELLALAYEIYGGRSTLQDLDALLRNDFMASNVSKRSRATIFFYPLLALILSASYKSFSNGSSTETLESISGQFGLTASPGNQRIGSGISLLVEVYLPFWTDPDVNRTYGFNMFVASNTTTAILDAPLPNYLNDLIPGLAVGDSLLISATVNATVSEMIEFPESDRNDPNFWNMTWAAYGQDIDTGSGPADPFLDPPLFSDNLLENAFSGMLAGSGDWGIYSNPNNTLVFLSIWNTTLNETFQSTAQAFKLSRRQCRGTWNITSSGVYLAEATLLETYDEAVQSQNQSLIVDNELGITPTFHATLFEYDYRFRGTWNEPMPTSSIAEPQYQYKTSTTSALVASMIWARQVSLWEPSRNNASSTASNNQYTIEPVNITTQREVITLRRDAGLVVVLASWPFLTIIALTLKTCLYSVPLGEGFGIISMLAGMKDCNLDVFSGASLSGQLSREITVRFHVYQDLTDTAFEATETSILVGNIPGEPLDLNFHELPLESTPSDSPYCDNWDILWLGCCHAFWSPTPDGQSKYQVVRLADTAVPTKYGLTLNILAANRAQETHYMKQVWCPSMNPLTWFELPIDSRPKYLS
ncbi:hypothetical protein MMC11_008766 [Xylographa trunciseda]|nr:hypothetical protein [Xylographa trunciseda]